MFKKYPFVKQEGIKDCGVASLMMIIKYYKGTIGFEQLRDVLKTTKKGTTAYHLIEGAKQIGFDAKGVKCKLEELNDDNIVLPAIAHVVINKTYNHYIVIYEINFAKKTMLIADPNDSKKKITFNQFQNIWNNVLILLYPIYSLKKYKPTHSIYNFITNITKQCKMELKNIWLLSLFLTLFSISTSFFLKYMIDSLLVNPIKDNLFAIFIIFLFLYLLLIITDFFRNKVLIYLNQKVAFIMTMDTFKQIIQLPYNYYCNRTTGEVVSRINDLTSVNTAISKVFYSVFIDLPLAIFVLIFLYFISPKLFIIVIILLLLYILNILVFKPIYSQYIEKTHKNKANVSSYMFEGISNFETIKAINLEKTIINNFEVKYIKLLKKMRSLDEKVNYQHTIKELINHVGFVVIIYCGSLLVKNHQLTIGELLTFNSLLVYFFEPIHNVINIDANIKEALNSIKRIIDLYYYEEDNGVVMNCPTGDIILSKLNYSYNDRDEILNNINLKISSGEKVLVVGTSGSGKSTLLKILMKYYKVNRGQVLLNNIDINDYIEKDYKQGISYVSQKESLFTDTLINNLNVNHVSKNSILEIAQMCEVDEIIKKSNTGYKMLIEEGGHNISGGEKQRIILARALLKPFNILLVDEGMNQMDVNLERRILKRMLEKYKEKTIIIVSHRLNNLDLFDKLVELEFGTIKKTVIKND